MNRSPALPVSLREEVARLLDRPSPRWVRPVVAAIQGRFGDSLEAVLFYGSALRGGEPDEGIIDVFVVVSGYRQAYRGWLLPVMNRFLPPNWLYLETGEGAGRLRVKLSVLSVNHFAVGTERWFHSYLWARMAQPSRLLWARDAKARARVEEAVAHAVLTFHREVLPTLSGEVDPSGIWRAGLVRTYGAELRPEGEGRADHLVQESRSDLVALTRAALPGFTGYVEPQGDGSLRVTPSTAEARLSRWRWRVRTIWGKAISTLRLGKGALIFEGAADYVASKIERHTGTGVRVTPAMRRYPFLFAPLFLVIFLKKRVLR